MSVIDGAKLVIKIVAVKDAAIKIEDPPLPKLKNSLAAIAQKVDAKRNIVNASKTQGNVENYVNA